MKTTWAILALLAMGGLTLGIAWIFAGSKAAKRARAVVAGLALGALILAMGWIFYFQDQPFFVELRRPANVPKDAVFLLVVKGVIWEHCTYDPHEDADHCQVWNGDGGVISDEVYLPFDGGPAVKADRLRIRKAALPGIMNAICLGNGRALLPKWLVDRDKERGFPDIARPVCPPADTGALSH